MDVQSVFQRSVERDPTRDAIVNLQTGDRHTYAELEEWVHSVANGLEDLGVEKGDRVAACLPNLTELAVTFLATQELGAIITPFNVRVAAQGLKYHVNDSDSDVLLIGPTAREKVESVSDALECETIVDVGPDPLEGAVPFETLEDAPADSPSVDVAADDYSSLVYTSGTTGDPKGVLLDHESCITRAQSMVFGQGYDIGETMVGGMPLYHTVGLHAVFLTVISISGTFCVLPSLDPERYVEAIDEEGVTSIHEAPTIFNMLLNADGIDEGSFETVEKVGYSGAPIKTQTFEQVQETFDPDLITNVYGSTEIFGPVGWENRLADETPSRIGRYADFFDRFRIIEIGTNDPSATVDEGDEGELIVGMDSPEAFTEYWNKPHETEAVTTDGWYFTGDVAYRDDDGSVVVSGRVDDMIISGGENIYPAEIEDVLVSHPAVEDIGVIGVDSEEWNETPKAFVQVSENLTAEDLHEWLGKSEKLADFKRPREYEFVEQIPRNPSGKVMRYKLRELEP